MLSNTAPHPEFGIMSPWKNGSEIGEVDRSGRTMPRYCITQPAAELSANVAHECYNSRRSPGACSTRAAFEPAPQQWRSFTGGYLKGVATFGIGWVESATSMG